MIEFICLFFPAFISVCILSSLQKRKFIWQDYVTAYAIFVSVINFIIALIVTLFFGDGDYVMDSLFINLFTVKYLFIAFVVALSIPFCFEIIRRNIEVRISVDRVNKD